MKNKLSDMAFDCECAMFNAVDSVRGAVNKSKKIILHPKMDASFKIKTKSDQNELFSSKIYFDKEISLFKVLVVVFGAIVALTVIASFIKSMCNSSSCCKDECNINE